MERGKWIYIYIYIYIWLSVCILWGMNCRPRAWDKCNVWCKEYVYTIQVKRLHNHSFMLDFHFNLFPLSPWKGIEKYVMMLMLQNIDQNL